MGRRKKTTRELHSHTLEWSHTYILPFIPTNPRLGPLHFLHFFLLCWLFTLSSIFSLLLVQMSFVKLAFCLGNWFVRGNKKFFASHERSSMVFTEDSYY